MRKKIEKIKKIIYCYPKLSLFILTLIISVLPIIWLKGPIFTDETGTIGSVAYLNGYDWSVLTAGNGNYYKCGQALLYYPMFLFFHSPVALYKGMLFVNALLVSLIPVFAYMIMNELSINKNRNEMFLFSLVIGVMPAVLLNSKYGWAESILTLLPWIIAYFLLKLSYIHVTDVQKKFYSTGLAIFSMYAFMSHQRGIVIVIATLFIVIFIRYCLRKDMINYYYFTFFLVGMMILDYLIGGYFKSVLFGTYDVKANTISTSLELEYLLKIFTYPGLSVLVKEIIGWLFAFFVSTYGVGAFAIVMSICFMIKVLKERFNFHKMDEKQVLFMVFSMLIFIGSFLLGILFFYKAAYLYYNEIMVTRADRMIYTRYIDSTYGLICLMGLLNLSMNKTKIIKKVSCILFLCIMILSYVYILPKLDNEVIWTHTISFLQFVSMNDVSLGHGVSSGLSANIGYIIVDNLSTTLFITSIFALVIFWGIGKIRNKKVSMALLLCIYLLGYIGNLKKFTIPISQYYYSLNEDIEKYIDEKIISPDFMNLYVDEDIIRESVQFHFPMFNVYTARNEGGFPSNMFVISARKPEQVPIYDDDFHYFSVMIADEVLHVYIKGEELNEFLNENGIITY